MRAYVNELALAEACAVAAPEYAPLVALVKERHRHAVLKNSLFCIRTMPDTPVRKGLLLRDVGQRLPKDQQRLFFSWADKQGPFIDDDQQPADLDRFLFGEKEVEVTKGGLGEAARRILSSQTAGVLSPVEDTASRFAADPLVVIHRPRGDVRGQVLVQNFLDGKALAEAIQDDEPSPTNWTDALSQAERRFDRLWIGDHCSKSLSKVTFRPRQNSRMSELFDVLQKLMEEMDDNGRLSTSGQELYNKHFVGKRAWFSDESESNKQHPERYTFPGPDGSGRITCFWHGKIRSDELRMHFEWPPANPVGRLRIAYIGRHR